MSGPRHILITGASSGIGAAVAIASAREGWSLALTGRDAVRLRQTVAACEGAGAPSVRAHGVDLGQPWIAARDLRHAFSGVDAIVNAAGMASFQSIGDTEAEFFDHTMRVNAVAPAAIIAAFWGDLAQSGRGCVVNISSMSSVDPYFNLFAYAASKAALDSHTRCIARDGAAAGIRAWSVLPGVVETPMLRGLFTEEQVPRQRAYPPSAIASIVVDLIAGRRADPSGALIELRADP